jgi:hypothetical protein
MNTSWKSVSLDPGRGFCGAQSQENGDLGLRLKAWHQLGGSELCDCRKFHDLIGESTLILPRLLRLGLRHLAG